MDSDICREMLCGRVVVEAALCAASPTLYFERRTAVCKQHPEWGESRERETGDSRENRGIRMDTGTCLSSPLHPTMPSNNSYHATTDLRTSSS